MTQEEIDKLRTLIQKVRDSDKAYFYVQEQLFKDGETLREYINSLKKV